MNKSSDYRQTSRYKKILLSFLSIFPVFFLLVSISMAAPELIKDINPDGGSAIYNLSADNGLLFFSAQSENQSSSRQIWVSDGSDDGTMQMTTFDSSVYGIQISNKSYLAINGIYFFPIRRRSDNEYELWRSDGTVAGTFKLKDLPDYLDNRFQAVGAGGLYYFVPWSDPEYGRELWVSDGTTSGTKMVKDINPGTGSSSPHNLIEANDRLYFLSGDDLWRSDGTSEGTRLITNFEEHYTRGMRYITKVNDVIYLGYLSGQSGAPYELWRHDPTSEQTVLVKSFAGLSSDGKNREAIGDMLYFAAKGVGSVASNQNAYDLWKSDGSPEGTVLVKNFEYFPGPDNLTNVNGTLFFTARDQEHGTELWKSDGTTTGTFMIKDVNGTSSSSELNCFTAVGEALFFIYKKTNYVKDLWISYGTELGTINAGMGVDNLRCPVNSNGQLYVYGNDKTNDDYGSELYRYNLSNDMLIAPEIYVSTNGLSVNVSWDVVENADGYTLFYAPYPYAGPETIESFELGDTLTFSIDLWSGAAYYVALKAHNSAYTSEYSNTPFFIVSP